MLYPISLILLTACLGNAVLEAEPVMLGSRLELLVDDYLIETFDNAALRLASPRDTGAVLMFDKPWEGRYCGYVTVLHDHDRYLMFYRGLPESHQDGTNHEVTCVAVSSDGVVWTKPELDIFPQDAAPKNNIVLAGHAPYSHNFSPFLDRKPGVPDHERFKAIAGTESSGLAAFVSPDGFQWTLLRASVITEGAFDSQNVAFWSEAEQCYACYFRTWTEGGYRGYRWVSRSTSSDFVHWSPPEVMDAGNTTPEHLYTNQTQPYFRAPHIYLAVAARFMPGRGVITAEQAAQLGIEANYYKDCSDVVLMTSRGGNRYQRHFMEGFIRPGIGLEHWSSRSNYPACGLLQTGQNELSLYIQHQYAQPAASIHRYVLRLDSFASLHAPYSGGHATTRILRFSGSELFLNFSTSAAGTIRIGLLEPNGRAIPGFSLEDCDEIFGNSIARKVTWGSRSDLSTLAGHPVCIHISLKDSDIYSLQFK